MGFRENLQHLRSTRDMSQADLAQQLGVSRQSVAKWEAEKSYPEMDKLIKICDFFQCSLDDLVRGDLTGGEAELAVVAVEPADSSGYDEHMRRRAWDYAVGLAAIVLSIGVGLFVSYPNVATALVPFFISLGVGVGVALFLMVPAYTGHQMFMREHPHIEDLYPPEKKAEARRRKAFGIVGAVVLAAAGLNMPGLFATFNQYTFSGLALFLCLAAAVGVLVYAIMMDHRLDVARYNAAVPAAAAEEC